MNNINEEKIAPIEIDLSSNLKSFEKNGLSDPRTLGNRHKLERAIANFEKETSMKWPFK